MIKLDLPFASALASLTLQLVIAIAMFLIARAPDWERVKVFGMIALTAAIYNAFDVMTSFGTREAGSLDWVIRINLTVGAAHASAWLWYTYGDAKAAWKTLPAWVRWLAIGNLAGVAFVSAAGMTVAPGVTSRLFVPSLGVDMPQPVLSTVGSIAAAVVILTLGVSFAEYVRRARRGVAGATSIAIGFALFGLFALEEVLVSAGVINFIYLADVGYACVVAPVTIQLFLRFSNHARRLADMSESLAVEVQERTSERDEAREALFEQQRLGALGALAGGVGHEINNPLQYLLFSLEELRARAGPTSSVMHDDPLENAFEGADRIRRAVDGLRTYARPPNESFAAVDVHEVVHTAVRIAAPQLRMKTRVQMELAAVSAAYGDEHKLVQVLVNVLVNAAQSLESHDGRGPPLIRVRTRMIAADSVEIAIADNGPGFASEVFSRLGEPYVTTKASTGAIGLGVFVSRGLIDAHGGTLLFENAPEGGAIVRVRLPVTVLAPRERPRTSSEMCAVATEEERRVLLVDDDPQVLRVIARGLGRRGYLVKTASDGIEAMALADTEPFDVVVSDLMMPRMSGIELAAALDGRHPGLRRRMILITGGAVTPAAEAFVQRAGLPVLSKPVELALLCDEIDRCGA